MKDKILKNQVWACIAGAALVLIKQTLRYVNGVRLGADACCAPVKFFFYCCCCLIDLATLEWLNCARLPAFPCESLTASAVIAVIVLLWQNDGQPRVVFFFLIPFPSLEKTQLMMKRPVNGLPLTRALYGRFSSSDSHICMFASLWLHLKVQCAFFFLLQVITIKMKPIWPGDVISETPVQKL